MIKFTQRIFAGHNQEFPLWNSKVPPFPENLQTLDGKRFHQRCNLWNLPQHYISQPTAQSWSNNLETSLCQNRLYPSELWNIVTEQAYNLSQRLSRIQQRCQVRIIREKSNNIKQSYVVQAVACVSVYFTDSHICLYSIVLQYSNLYICRPNKEIHLYTLAYIIYCSDVDS